MRAQLLATESDAPRIGTAVWPNGERLRDWRVGAPLGRGGTAEVWHARAPDGREAALKLAKPELRRHAAAHAAIRREHEVLRRVASAHVVECYELLDCNGVAVLALHYLPHGDLVPLLGLPPRHWLRAYAGVVAALRALEGQGLAHGDVKARNVLFAADGGARLIDLSHARALDDRAAPATAAYGPPPGAEARAGEADCFALAVLLYELSAGRLPYGPDGAAAGGAEPPVVPLEDPAAARLLAAAVAALRSGGRGLGLSYFADVIESVRAVYG
jgi:serine/threonine-protein kinase